MSTQAISNPKIDKEQTFLHSYRGWLMEQVADGAYTGNLTGALDDCQMFLDLYSQQPTQMRWEIYENRKNTFFLMLEGVGR